MEIKDFPLLSAAEFSDACQALEFRYTRSNLGPVRKEWKLRLRTALGTVFHVLDSDADTTYIRITCPLKPAPDSDNDLSVGLANLHMSDRDELVQDDIIADEIMADAEESDTATLKSSIPQQAPEFVVYEIHLHPTYRIPCLWFSLHNLASHEPALKIDTVFRRLVPDGFKKGLDRVNGIGGISIDNHPITGVPCFFLHPCMVGDALSTFDCSTQDYLMIWLGLVGGCVGLWAPKEMVVQ